MAKRMGLERKIADLEARQGEKGGEETKTR